MGKPLSIDLRERVLAFVETGYSRRAAGRHFDVSASFVMKFMARVRVTGSIEPARQGRPPGKGKLAPFALFLGTRVDAEPDITMPELAGALFEAHGIRVSPAALSRFLIREGYSYKKTLIATERGRQEVRRERDAWVTRRQPWMRLEPHRLVFIDGEVPSAIGPSEAPNATTTKMTRPRGRSWRPLGGRGSVWPLENANLHRRAQVPWLDRALGAGRPDEPGRVRHLYRDPASANLEPGRCRHSRQSLLAQERQGRADSETARRLVPLPAAVLSRSEPYRDGLLQAQGPPSGHESPNNRGAVESHRRYLRSVLA